MKLKLVILTLSLLSVSLNLSAQSKKKSKDKKDLVEPSKKGIKPFSEVITKKAKTSKGLLTVHQVDDKWYFEISDSIFNREMMTVTRYSKTVAGVGMYGGEQIGSQVIKWEKGPNDKIFLKSITYVSYSQDSTKPIYTSVKNSNADPIIGVFDIKAIKKDTSILIEVGEFFNDDNQTFSVDPYTKDMLKMNRFQKDKSYVNKISSFPINTEIKTVKTFDALAYNPHGNSTPAPAGMNSGFITLELNTSIVLLPKTPMQKRMFDARVGYFANELSVYGEESQKMNTETFAIRWRLEPKNAEDAARQAKGELIEPKKPIVYYIDPATPEKWKKYLKAGIDDWQVAFEQAGWKNAIRGEYWPENDSTMNLEDARFSVIRYFASDIQNAYGPNVHDPRSGEIIESHIGWYHNLMSLLHDWYFIQTAPNDPKARVREFDDDLMGKLIQFVSSHEVGHTLGLRHNMGASSATPVEKLRDKNWVKENGHTSSIMDYARFNYVAQPEDGVEDYFPRIGDYDKWAIQWGYSYFSNAKNVEEEEKLLNDLTIQKIKNPRMRFGTEVSPSDPRYQTEDLGDNAMKASEYGIKNLQRIVPNLIEWTKENGEDYSELERMFGNVVGQYRRYVGHVSKYVGGIYDTPKTYDMEGNVYEVVSKEMQIEALNFLTKQVFQTPNWLLDQNINSKIKAESGVESIKAVQTSAINMVLAGDKLVRIMESSVLSKSNLTLDELFTQLKGGIFTELSSAAPIDIYRRNLQKTYINSLVLLLKPTTVVVRSIPPGASYGMRFRNVELGLTDVPSTVRANLETIRKEIKAKIATTTDISTKNHLIDLLNRISVELDPK